MMRRLLLPLAVAAVAILVVGLGVWTLDLLSGSSAEADSLRPIVLGSSGMATTGPGAVRSSTTLPATTSTTVHHAGDTGRHETVLAPVQSRSTGMMTQATTTRTGTMSTATTVHHSTATTVHHSYDGASAGTTAPMHDGGGTHDGGMQGGH